MKEVHMKNLLTFTTASGKTQLRGYVKVALGLFVILVVLFGVNAYNRYQMVSEVMAAPRPLDANLIPAPTEQVAVPAAPVEECPSNPADWTLTENTSAPGSNLKNLSTDCVYDGLEMTAAWVYATTALGYTRAEAAAVVGLQNPQIIYFPDGTITVLTDYKDEPQQVALNMAVDHPDLAEWRIGASRESGLELTFSGCFRTSSISGGEVNNWGDGYPVVCQFFADYQTEYSVTSVNSKVLTLNNVLNVRRPTWFGYAGAGRWVWLGTANVWEVDLSQIPPRGRVTIDSAVMDEKYGITALSLPQNWKAAVGEEFANAIVAELNGEQ